MKEWKKNIWLKTGVIVLLMISMVMLLLSGILLVYLGSYDYYERGMTRESMIKWRAYTTGYNDAWEIYSMWRDMRNEGNYNYSAAGLEKENYNMSIRIRNERGVLLYENYAPSKDAYTFEAKMEEYVGYNPSTGEDIYSYYTVECAIDLGFPAKDSFWQEAERVNFFWRLRTPVVVVLILSGVSTLFFFTCAIRGAGHKAGLEGISLRWEDRLPLDGYLCVLGAAACYLFWICIEILQALYFGSGFPLYILLAAVSVLDCLVILEGILTLAIRVKVGKWWRNTILYVVLRYIWRGAKYAAERVSYLWRNIALIWRWVLLIAVWLMLELLMVAGGGVYALLSLSIGERIVLIPILLIFAIGLHRIVKQGKSMAEGNLDSRMDTRMLYGSLKHQAEHLNRISDGMQKAVDARLKSEHFKTELITNVSHDIKTPLTSIINYVDLLQKQELPEEAEGYVEILQRQSARLKKLIEDLIEASKASTGNIKTELQPMQAALLLSQAVGEYEERFAERQLKVVAHIREEAPILADGRLAWRVLDNLFNNICKYAQEGTRVYIDCDEWEGKVRVILRNISKYQLNVSEEELMERFVRGDRSRHTEGNGLGLSIAQSLMQLQGGTMHIAIDGDLFKAVLEFAKAE